MSSETEAASLVSVGSTARVPTDLLVLDRHNPRLVTLSPKATDAEIVAALYRGEDLGELLESIAGNGYLDIEPLIVLADAGRLVVLEGNRRLAAIRLFREPDLAGRVFDEARVKVTIPPIPERYEETLRHVTVFRVDSRQEAWPFIGFKHINGAAKWDSYAKAKFAADWYRRGGGKLADIATRIGDKHATVKRMVYAIYVLEQADSKSVFRMDDRASERFNFSHLYTALSRAAYMEFLGLETSWTRFDPQPDPVPETHLEQLAEVLRWLYGSREDGVAAVVQSQNPDIKNLGAVLGSGEGLAVLRSGGSLSDAHASTMVAGRRLSEALLRARKEVREASNSLRGFDGRDQALVDIAEDISETAQAIHKRMREKMQRLLFAGE